MRRTHPPSSRHAFPVVLYAPLVGNALVFQGATAGGAFKSRRASAIGIYRFCQDLGYAPGAVVAGVAADLLGPSVALRIVAGLIFMSGVIVSARMLETFTRAVVSRTPAR